MTEDELRVERVSADQLHDLRRRVLRDDDPAIYHPDPRDDDATSLHYGGFVGPRLVVSASFFPSSPPRECFGNSACPAIAPRSQSAD